MSSTVCTECHLKLTTQHDPPELVELVELHELCPDCARTHLTEDIDQVLDDIRDLAQRAYWYVDHLEPQFGGRVFVLQQAAVVDEFLMSAAS